MNIADLEKTRPFTPSPGEGDLEINSIIDRVNRKDEQLKGQFTEALKGVVGEGVKVLDFKSVGDKKFEVTFEVGGKADMAVIQAAEPLPR